MVRYEGSNTLKHGILFIALLTVLMKQFAISTLKYDFTDIVW